MKMTVRNIADEELLRRAVRSARDTTYRKGVKYPRWVGVMRVFALGSTYAHELCQRFDLDPDEMVKR